MYFRNQGLFFSLWKLYFLENLEDYTEENENHLGISIWRWLLTVIYFLLLCTIFNFKFESLQSFVSCCLSLSSWAFSYVIKYSLKSMIFNDCMVFFFFIIFYFVFQFQSMTRCFKLLMLSLWDFTCKAHCNKWNAGFHISSFCPSDL